MDATLQDSHSALQRLFIDIGPEVVKYAGNIASTQKNDGSLVTEIDVSIEQQIISFMKESFPDVKVLGEESGYSEELPSTCWLIDPIDGTESFINNIPSFTTMAVLIQNNRAVASIIYNPSTKDIYTAEKGKGAYKNGVRLDLRQQSPAATAWCKGRFIPALSELFPEMTFEIGPHGAGHGFSMVAEGKIAARFQLPGGGQIHDYATGTLLVAEAFGSIIPTDSLDYSLHTRSLVACHPSLAQKVKNNLPKIRGLEQFLR